MASSAILVSATNVSPGKNGGLLFGYWDTAAEAASAPSNKISGQVSKKNDLALVPLAKANNSIDPNEKPDDQLVNNTLAAQGIVSAIGASPMRDPEEDGGVKMYIVQQGDTISSIAAKNKISVNTIMWANDLENVDSIKPGDTIFILPISGIQHKVKQGDTIDSIASKYKADKNRIIAFNDLPANGDIDPGKEITIPDGQGETPQPTQAPAASSIIEKRQYANATGGTPQVSGKTGADKSDGKPGTGHKFPYGYCTWYVAQKRYVPWGGNAGTWLYHAKALGYATGRTPRPGAIVVTTENRYYGHVALVEKVSGNSFTVSEMNYAGFAKKSVRSISTSSRAIKGFIY